MLSAKQAVTTDEPNELFVWIKHSIGEMLPPVAAHLFSFSCLLFIIEPTRACMFRGQTQGASGESAYVTRLYGCIMGGIWSHYLVNSMYI